MKDPGPFETDSDRHPGDPASVFFGPKRRRFTATAPGRLDVMGGVADYSGSLVLEMPLLEATRAELALRKDGEYRVHSTTAATRGDRECVTYHLPTRFSYASIRKDLKPRARWAAYAIGCAAALIKEKGIACRGADIWIDSQLPPGRGVSASAALEVAVMSAFGKAFKIKWTGTELPALCQLVENKVVGAPCGIMDQLCSYLGRANHLLPILCQPMKLGLPLPIPDGLLFIGIDSGVEHAVSENPYADARTAAFMGYEIIRRERRKRRPFNGCLANIPVSEFEQHVMPLLPESMSGRSFLRQYGKTIDPESKVHSSRSYAVFAASAHPVYEHARVRLFKLLLDTLNRGGLAPMEREELLLELGELMYQSHASYGTIGLGHAATDLLVEGARKAGPAAGIYGAKITGGGSGGTVCLLVDGEHGLESALRLAKRRRVFLRSGEGARWR